MKGYLFGLLACGALMALLAAAPPDRDAGNSSAIVTRDASDHAKPPEVGRIAIDFQRNELLVQRAIALRTVHSGVEARLPLVARLLAIEPSTSGRWAEEACPNFDGLLDQRPTGGGERGAERSPILNC